ncbi:hypothetical protein GHT06_004566 [Daphnia sinensis]|uniref:Uncharacterized protein n=1 Tax=Daphnia sinensis TaxID=1820382 RepID=A0AAD5KFJ1_9CRUS|nr:hypothetical protein GHT06_004566 [Daphnia sinensis]
MSRSRNPPTHRFAEPQLTVPTNGEIAAQEARLLVLRAATPSTNESAKPLRVAAKTIRNKNKRLVAVDKSHVKLFKENGVQSLFLVLSPNNKGTSWGIMFVGLMPSNLSIRLLGRSFLLVERKSGMVPPSQSALVGNSLDVGQPLLENRRTTTPGNEESTQGDDVERYASPMNRSSTSECDSNFLAQSDKQTMPVQFPIFGDTDFEARAAGTSPNSSILTQPLHRASRSSTTCPSEPFPMQQNRTNTSPISRISPFLFPMKVFKIFSFLLFGDVEKRSQPHVPTELQLHFRIPLDVSELLPSLGSVESRQFEQISLGYCYPL